MERIVEPELMDDRDQALAYANADFEFSNSLFIERFDGEFGELEIAGFVADLGCGPADIAMRFARRYPSCTIHGIDGAAEMLAPGVDAIAQSDVAGRVELFQVMLPGELPRASYDAVISNSLLHHLHDPAVLWNTIAAIAVPGAPIAIMDLRRPQTTDEATELVEQYSAGEPEVLRRDFYHSLCAAFLPDEIEAQLRAANLDGLRVETISDRHLWVYGRR